jgi:hypothetical protein
MLGISTALLILCLLPNGIADSASFIYKEINRGVFSKANFSVVCNRSGYSISVSSTKGKEQSMQELNCDSTYATIRWHYSSNNNTDIVFRRNADRIELSGTLKGNPVNKILKIDNQPWYQVVPLGLQTASWDSIGRSKFWVVSLDKPAVLEPVCFHIARITDRLLPNHPEIACRCFHMNIEGLPTQIWVGDYFIRREDHIFLYYQGYSFGSKKPTGTIEAVIH